MRDLVDKNRSDLADLFNELTQQAEIEAKKHWVETGNMPPQENAMLAVLLKRIKLLEQKSND